MRRTLLTAALLALTVPTTGRAGDADAEKELGGMTRQTHEAMVKGDTAALDVILADDWVVIDPYGNIVSKAKQAKDLKDGTTRFVAIDNSEVKARAYGDAGVVTCRCQVKLNFNGNIMDNAVRITEFYARQGGKWRCVSAQTTFIPAQPGQNR